MAITDKAYNELQKETSGYLNISAEDFYFNKIRPFMQEMLMKCRTDGELIRTLEKVINSADSFCVQKDYAKVMDSFVTLETAITDKNYFNNAMKKAPEAEKEMVRELIAKISDLRIIIKCEPPYTPAEKKTKDRLNYRAPQANSPVGENEDYYTHNMKKLNESSPKTRIPNV